jgi:hypothetical protein
MLPYALFAHAWPAAGGDMFNVVDPDNRVYGNGSTISIKSVRRLGLRPIASDEDAQAIIHMTNAAWLGLQLPEVRS